jgi:hypothetical protein
MVTRRDALIDINTAANIAEICGGIAILVSLVYVGYQIKQSNRIASAMALQSVLDRFSDRNLNQYMKHPEITEILVRGHRRLDDLSVQDQVIFNAWLIREIMQMQNIMQLYTNGLLGRVDYHAWLAFTVAQLTTPGGSESWRNQKLSLTPTIVTTIETFLKDNPQTPSLIQLYPKVYGEEGYLAS